MITGGGILVNVPAPARFALHKLIVARSRTATQQTKSGKDLDQAAQIIELLAEDRPGDLAAAWEVIRGRRSLLKAAEAGVDALKKQHAAAHAALRSELRV